MFLLSDENLKIDDVETRRYWADFDKIPLPTERFIGCRVIRQDGINQWDGKVYQLAFPGIKDMIVYCIRTKKKYVYRDGYWEKMKQCNVKDCKELSSLTLLGKPICDFHSKVYP